jgi:hypothetical protein
VVSMSIVYGALMVTDQVRIPGYTSSYTIKDMCAIGMQPCINTPRFLYICPWLKFVFTMLFWRAPGARDVSRGEKEAGKMCALLVAMIGQNGGVSLINRLNSSSTFYQYRHHDRQPSSGSNQRAATGGNSAQRARLHRVLSRETRRLRSASRHRDSASRTNEEGRPIVRQWDMKQ